MSEESTSEDEQPEVDDVTLSEVVRRPTRTAGDLSEVADASRGITTEDLARDLEAVASKQGAPTDSELLADLLERVKRIEEHLGITNYGFRPTSDTRQPNGRHRYPPLENREGSHAGVSGARWNDQVAVELERTNFGIICLTKANQERPWVLFEAGALAKGLKWLGWCPSVSTSFRRISGDRSRHSKRAPWTRRACVPCARRECGA